MLINIDINIGKIDGKTLYFETEYEIAKMKRFAGLTPYNTGEYWDMHELCEVDGTWHEPTLSPTNSYPQDNLQPTFIEQDGETIEVAPLWKVSSITEQELEERRTIVKPYI